MQRLLEKQKKLEQLAAKQQQQAEEAKNQTTKNSTSKTEKTNAIIDSSSKYEQFLVDNNKKTLTKEKCISKENFKFDSHCFFYQNETKLI